MLSLAQAAGVGWMTSYHSWIILAGTFVFGDSIVLAASGLAAHGQWSVGSVILWSFLGTLISDTMWFKLADRTLQKIMSDPAREAAFVRMTARMDRWVGESPHRGLLFVKFLWGTRTLSIVYMASREVSTRTFVLFDAIGTLLWLAVLVPIGFLAGHGVANLSADLTRLEYALPILLVLAIVLQRGRTWILNRRLLA